MDGLGRSKKKSMDGLYKQLQIQEEQDDRKVD